MPAETPKRFKVGDILTWLPAYDPRVNGYKYGGVYQKGKGEITKYKDFHHSYNCWNIDVRHPSGSVYRMIESEFEEYYSTDITIKPGDKIKILIDYPANSPLKTGAICTVRCCYSDKSVTIEEGGWSISKSMYSLFASVEDVIYDPGTFKPTKSPIKPGDTIRILKDNANMSPLKKGHLQTVKSLIDDHTLTTTHGWQLDVSNCEKVEKSDIDTTPVRVTESDITCPIKIGEVVMFLVDNPWGSSLRKGDKAMVDVIDHYRKQVFLNTGGKFRGWVPICDLHTVYKSVDRPIAEVPTDKVIIPEKPKKLHPTPILFKTEEEPSFKIQVKHHKPIVVRGIGS